MAATSSQSIDIWHFPTLKGRVNYRKWSRSMKNALLYEGFWRACEPNTRPGIWAEEKEILEDGTGRITRCAPNLEQLREIQDRQVEWDTLNMKATGLILHKCDSIPADLIEDLESAQEIWKELGRLYQDPGSYVSRHLALQELRETTLSSCDYSVESYAMTIRAKAKDLERMGAKLEDWVVVSVLLNNLEGRFRDYTHGILLSLPKNPDPEQVITKLMLMSSSL